MLSDIADCRDERIDVVLLVGGLGTRLRSVLGENTPKALAQINGKPFLFYLMRYLSDQGFNQVKLATAHLSESFQDEFKTYVPDGMDVGFSFEKSPRGTGGAIVEALGVVQSEPFFVMNGDSFVFVPLREMLEKHKASGAIASVALVEVPNSDRFGTVLTDADDNVTAFQEKTGIQVPGWINAGIYILSKEAMGPVIDQETSSVERDVFPHWVGNGLRGFKVKSPFIDIGLPETYESAGQFFVECGLG